MKKIIITVLCVILVFSFTACTKRSDLVETEDTAEMENTIPEGKCIFDYEEVVDTITQFGRSHGLTENNSLCYKSDSFYKIDTTRITSEFELQEKYEDAIRDIVANGNMLNADRIGFFVESVLLNEDGYFIIYINYEYEYQTDRY